MDQTKLAKRLRRFAEERDWEQYHSPKNLAMALSVEVSELLEHFQWMTEIESSSLDAPTKTAISTEIADVQIYLTRLADILGVDIDKAIEAKLVANAEKYPADKVRGSAKKYASDDGVGE